jgi:hypothetical protein
VIGLPGYAVPVGRTVLTTPVRLEAGQRLVGAGQTNFNPHGEPGISGGAILEVRHSDGPAIILESGASIDNIAFDYPDQEGGYAEPLVYPPTIKLGSQDFGGYEQSITNCTFYKSYCGIDARGSTLGNIPFSNLTIKGNRGVTLNSFLELDYLADWAQIEGNNLNAGRIAPLFLKTGLVRWVAENGAMFRIGGCDWLQLRNNQAWGYRYGVKIEAASGYGASGPYTITGNQFDATQTGVDLSGTFAQAVRIRDNVFCPFNAVTGEQGIAVNVNDGVTVDGIAVTDNEAFGPMKHFLWAPDWMQSARIASNRARSTGSTGYGISIEGKPYKGDNILRGFAG